MKQPIVLVTFYSRSGATEKLALAAAVGAVQGRALIRLRRVPDLNASEGSAEIRRMQREYVAPREADVLGAHGLIIAPPPGSSTSAPEWTPYLDLLAEIAAAGKLGGKVGAIVDTASEATLQSFTQAIGSLGLLPVPTAGGADGVERATALGRSVAARLTVMFA